jgi:hypothetical protein
VLCTAVSVRSAGWSQLTRFPVSVAQLRFIRRALILGRAMCLVCSGFDGAGDL